MTLYSLDLGVVLCSTCGQEFLHVPQHTDTVNSPAYVTGACEPLVHLQKEDRISCRDCAFRCEQCFQWTLCVSDCDTCMITLCDDCLFEHASNCHPASIQTIETLLRVTSTQQEQTDEFESMALGVALSASATSLCARNRNPLYKNFLVAPTRRLPSCGRDTEFFQYNFSILVQTLLDSDSVRSTSCPTSVVQEIAHYAFGYIVQCAHCHCYHHTPSLQGQFHC